MICWKNWSIPWARPTNNGTTELKQWRNAHPMLGGRLPRGGRVVDPRTNRVSRSHDRRDQRHQRRHGRRRVSSSTNSSTATGRGWPISMASSKCWPNSAACRIRPIPSNRVICDRSRPASERQLLTFAKLPTYSCIARTTDCASEPAQAESSPRCQYARASVIVDGSPGRSLRLTATPAPCAVFQVFHSHSNQPDRQCHPPLLTPPCKTPAQALDAHVARNRGLALSSKSTGCPFWLEFRKKLKFDPLKEVRSFDDLKEVSAVRRRMAPRRAGAALGAEGLGDKPIYVFETGGTTGIPKSRIAHRRFSHRLLAVQRHAAREVLSARARTG